MLTIDENYIKITNHDIASRKTFQLNHSGGNFKPPLPEIFIFSEDIFSVAELEICHHVTQTIKRHTLVIQIFIIFLITMYHRNSLFVLFFKCQ